MVMVGGYVGDQLSCESPGIYVFDLSNLEWVQQYTALSSSDSDSNNEDSAGASNPFNQQTSQQKSQMNETSDFGGLQGSYGYRVPEAVIKVIGGDANGGATITKPVVEAQLFPVDVRAEEQVADEQEEDACDGAGNDGGDVGPAGTAAA